MRRAAFFALLLLFARNEAKACSMSPFQPDEILTNEPVVSANGRYLAIERWFPEIKDFEEARAGSIRNFDAPEPADDAPPVEPRKTITFAVYEANTRTRLSEFSIPIDDTGTFFVSDSGYIAIVRPLQGVCYTKSLNPAETFVTIVRSDGTLVARLTAADILTMPDIGYRERASLSSRIESEGRELLVLTIAGQERHIDLASGKLLDAKENILPSSVVFVDNAPRTREFQNEPFDDTSSVHLESRELLARAKGEPLPDYPEVARKARVTGPVWVEVIVSEYGEVLAARATKLPFGLREAAVKAVLQWRFRPLRVDGKHVKFNGEVAMHFERKVVQ